MKPKHKNPTTRQTQSDWKINCEIEVTTLRSRVSHLEAENQELRKLWSGCEDSTVKTNSTLNSLEEWKRNSDLKHDMMRDRLDFFKKEMEGMVYYLNDVIGHINAIQSELKELKKAKKKRGKK